MRKKYFQPLCDVRSYARHFKILCLCLLVTACGSYYSQQSRFHRLFLTDQIQEADHQLAKNKRSPKGRNKLLYYLNRGITHHLMQQYEESNAFFEQAYLIHEDFVAHPFDMALSFLVNPTLTDYRGEDHEILLIHYYKALNYLQIGDLSAALVECRRLNIQLNDLSDKYTAPDTYRRDAFIHVLMGLIYQANHAYNDAFIAYRNAVEVYEEDYKRLFGIQVPLQLKKDLIYVAYKTGFYDQVAHYQKKFQLRYDPSKEIEGGDVVCLWNNGLGPIKHEWGLDFVLVRGAGGVVNFVNEELGLIFPFPLANDSQANQDLSDLHLLRVAFPTYVERPLLYEKATIEVLGAVTARSEARHCEEQSDEATWQSQHHGIYPLEVAEDINAISFRVLHERMVWELSKSLLRVAIKKVAEYQLRKQNEVLGTILGVVNFATEKADTRNWQTLPHTISYVRLRLPAGQHQLKFQASTSHVDHEQHSHLFSVQVKPQQTIFYPVHTLQYAGKE